MGKKIGPNTTFNPSLSLVGELVSFRIFSMCFPSQQNQRKIGCLIFTKLCLCLESFSLPFCFSLRTPAHSPTGRNRPRPWTRLELLCLEQSKSCPRPRSISSRRRASGRPKRAAERQRERLLVGRSWAVQILSTAAVDFFPSASERASEAGSRTVVRTPPSTKILEIMIVLSRPCLYGCCEERAR